MVRAPAARPDKSMRGQSAQTAKPTHTRQRPQTPNDNRASMPADGQQERVGMAATDKIQRQDPAVPPPLGEPGCPAPGRQRPCGAGRPAGARARAQRK
ncbi:hypothetical protein GCM10018780_81930 [Streptomyces lanatus]|nr:hypothetical protein GCM10018780_81930 [Streptomyces lanatus]